MKKVLLVGVNAKFIHSNLAIRSLKAYVAPQPVEICDLTINDNLFRNCAALTETNADIYGFSCYIFNIEYVLKLAEFVKKSCPDATILFGGPEVSFDGEDLLKQYDFIDYIIPGEGEEVFKHFLECIDNDDDPAINCPGIVSRRSSCTTIHAVSNLDQLPFPYNETEMEALDNKIIYYESMRGCPFNCAYCLSSTVPSVRFRSLDLVFKELDFFIAQNVKQVKFVDRTFNLRLDRTKAIIRFLSEKDCSTNFHFEIAADLLDDELIDMINHAPKERFQFEIGIQSTNTTTLSAITRKTDIARLGQNISALLKPNNAHIHVDLIAGLPYEDLNSFETSFNDAIQLRPHMLQLGFLKLLKGTRLREESDQYNYQFSSFQPYEVISNAWLNADELRLLKKIEEVVDRFYNSGMLKLTFKWLLSQIQSESAFVFFRGISTFLESNHFYTKSFSQKQLYSLTAVYFASKTDLIKGIDWIRLDALIAGQGELPDDLMLQKINMPLRFEIAKDETLIEKQFPKLIKDAPKYRVKKMRFSFLSNVFSNGLNEPVAVVYKDNYCVVDARKYLYED